THAGVRGDLHGVSLSLRVLDGVLALLRLGEGQLPVADLGVELVLDLIHLRRARVRLGPEVARVGRAAAHLEADQVVLLVVRHRAHLAVLPHLLALERVRVRHRRPDVAVQPRLQMVERMFAWVTSGLTTPGVRTGSARIECAPPPRPCANRTTTVATSTSAITKSAGVTGRATPATVGSTLGRRKTLFQPRPGESVGSRTWPRSSSARAVRTRSRSPHGSPGTRRGGCARASSPRAVAALSP